MGETMIRKYVTLLCVILLLVACENPLDPKIENMDQLIIVNNVQKKLCTSGHIQDIVASNYTTKKSAVYSVEQSCIDFSRTKGNGCKVYDGIAGDSDSAGEFSCLVGYNSNN